MYHLSRMNTKIGNVASSFYMSSETILLKTSFASIIISAVINFTGFDSISVLHNYCSQHI